MKAISVFALLLAAMLSLRAADAPRTFAGATPLEWSERLAQSEMKRLGHTLEAGGAPAAKWDYAPSVLALALVKLGEQTKNDAFIQYGTRAVASHVAADGTIAGYKAEDYSMDQVAPGKVLLAVMPRAPAAAPAGYTKALQMLRAQMAAQPRTTDGGFWHKQRYPNQMWLDGLYMASTFLAQYGQLFKEPALFDDVTKQILLIDRHLYDPATGLYWHAWDETHRQSWADPKTGVSPNFWSRSIGWYGMAIVDALDYLPADQREIAQTKAVVRRVADGIVKWQDPQSGVWWQMTTQGARQGNYLEASGSAMFVYTLAKAVNRGYLPREKYLPAILKGYEGLVREFIKPNPDGTIRLTRICQTAGLGYTTSAGRPRDGSFEYYISEPIVDNDPKGTGPFILAGLEVSRLLAPIAP